MKIKKKSYFKAINVLVEGGKIAGLIGKKNLFFLNIYFRPDSMRCGP